MFVKIIVYLRYAAGFLGLYVGLTFLNANPPYATAVASLLAVGVVGVLSFISHVFLHEEDAKQIGFSSKNVDFQFEVGFANVAFGIVAIVSFFANWGFQTNIALILGYALYLFQAGILHTVKSFSSKKTGSVNATRGYLTLVYSGFMIYLVFEALKLN